MNVLEVREFVGATWLVLTILLWLVLAWYLWERWRSQGWSVFRADMSNHGAIGMFVYVSGEACARLFSLIQIAVQHAPSADYEWSLLWFGGALGIWGVVCLIRVFAPRWSSWVAAAAVFMVFLTILLMRLGVYSALFG